MKKLLMLFGTLFIGTQLFGYTHTIINTSKVPVRAKVDIVAGYDKFASVNPGESAQVNVAGYCTRAIGATPLSGPAAGQLVSTKIRGNTCRAAEAYIADDPSTGGVKVTVQ